VGSRAVMYFLPFRPAWYACRRQWARYQTLPHTQSITAAVELHILVPCVMVGAPRKGSVAGEETDYCPYLSRRMTVPRVVQRDTSAGGRCNVNMIHSVGPWAT
jgi:hypothetical protein